MENQEKKNKTGLGAKRWLFSAAFLFIQSSLLISPMHAQIVDGEEEDDDEEEVTTTTKSEEAASDDIDFPEAMNEDLDSLLSLYHAKTYLSTDEDCKMGDINPVFSKETYMERLKRLPTVMEMPYNEVVQTFIERYTGRLRHSVSFMLGASNFFMPIFEEALELYQLPLELKYLPIIESALKPNAVSRAGAAGLWQFMVSTGKDYGLQINSLLDERRDPVRASYAAAHYLSDLYKIFGDWNLVIAAYNCGPSAINKAIHRAKGEMDYWKIYPYLPKETRGYVPAFIAANYVMNYYCEHNICPMRCELPPKTDTVMVTRDVHFDQIANVLGVDVEMLRSLNPAYRRNVVPGNTKPSAIRLIPNDIARFIDLQDSIYSYKTNELLTKRYEVEADNRQLSSSKRKSKVRGRRNRQGGSQSVTIRKGDTLAAIAKRNGTTVKKLKQLNGLKNNNVRAGKKLKVR